MCSAETACKLAFKGMKGERGLTGPEGSPGIDADPGTPGIDVCLYYYTVHENSGLLIMPTYSHLALFHGRVLLGIDIVRTPRAIVFNLRTFHVVPALVHCMSDA